MPATLSNFVLANDAVAATTKKLQKQQILADYLRPLDDADLPLTVRYSAGQAFASTDERVLGVSGAIVIAAVLPMLPIEPAAFGPLIVRSGEIGEAIAAALSSTDTTDLALSAAPLTLTDLAETFDELAAIGNIENKTRLVADVFARCHAAREAAYVAKIILNDLRTGAREGVLQAAVAIAFDKTLAQIQRCQLLVGDLGDVALLAKHDRLEAATFHLFHPIQFMLAVPRETAANVAETMAGRTYVAEHKLDGIRAQIHKSGTGDATRIAIYTRTMDRADDSFPDVAEAVAKCPGDFLVDGEIVPYRDGVVQPFANIQKRLGRKTLTPKILRDHPAAFIAFDLLSLDGELLMDQPLRERRSKLATLSDTLLLSSQVEVDSGETIDVAFCDARGCRNEGLVLKDPASPYTPGRRGTAWLKLKTHLPTLDCVVTAAEHGHGKRRAVLSDYTFAVWDRDPTDPAAILLNIGKAYSGVTDDEIRQLTELFLGISVGDNGRVHRVRPQVVFEIAFDQIQKSVRHASGYAFRFPRIKRIRWDKRPTDADTLQRVQEIFQSESNTARIDGLPIPAEPTLFDGM